MQKSDMALVEEIARRIAREEIRADKYPATDEAPPEAEVVDETTSTSNLEIESVTMTNDSETVTEETS